jgi:hypothetical protein
MMKVDYTLPGLLPEPPAPPAAQSEERPEGAFRSHLSQPRVPEVTDWRALLKLDVPAAGATRLGPPPTPSGVDSRGGESQRAWWRAMLHKHTSAIDAGPEDDSAAWVHRMLQLLLESQRSEDRIFARHFAEGRD